MLLGTVLEMPLLKASNLDLQNGSISILDLKVDHSFRMLDSYSDLLGGAVPQALASPLVLNVPDGEVIRINESRHLEGAQSHFV